jgi:hypothetical protein
LAKLTIDQFIRKLGQQQKNVQRVLLTALNRTTVILKRQVIKTHFSNVNSPGPRAVRKQSGKLQRSIRISQAVPENRGVTANMTIGTVYAKVHVARNKRGKTRITARRGKLAIPTRFARNASGVPIAPPRDPRWKPTHIVNNIIFGQAGGKSVPLFVLKKSVVVPQRISIAQDIVKPAQRIFKQQILREIKKIL